MVPRMGLLALARAQVDEKHNPDADKDKVGRHRVDCRRRRGGVATLREPQRAQTVVEREDVHHVLHALAQGHGAVSDCRDKSRDDPAHNRPQDHQRKRQSIAPHQAKHALGGQTSFCHHSLPWVPPSAGTLALLARGGAAFVVLATAVRKPPSTPERVSQVLTQPVRLRCACRLQPSARPRPKSLGRHAGDIAYDVSCAGASADLSTATRC